MLPVQLEPHFNSIKVRLEPSYQYYSSFNAHHFNSIKVRLEQESVSKMEEEEAISIP